MTRNAVFEGRFYPATREAVFGQITAIEQKNRYADTEMGTGKITGAVLPHAGHVYSGYQTVPFFRILQREGIKPETFVILNPNHTGKGPAVALDPHSIWKNCIGEVGLDMELASRLPYPTDSAAQAMEHSAEVIIPFIQYYFPNEAPMILPICMRHQSASDAVALAESLLSAIGEVKRAVILIASSDFSHFLTPDEGFRDDQLVLDQIFNRNLAAVEHTVTRNQISMCGPGPVMTLMAYTGFIDQHYTVRMLARGHSGEVHPSTEVVDYISVLFQINQ